WRKKQMGLLDKIKGLLGGNKKAVTDAVDKVADVVESKTPDSIDDKVEMAAEKVKDVIENVTDEK
ncbi:MAG TPA: antitoxin, partial [Ilumatobacteraceae bacterium]|nr:antitoxin [Ilumatobacteraceae bacterium]HRA84675.1 antitoxin [Ilumatobacteraceae bacterium]